MCCRWRIDLLAVGLLMEVLLLPLFIGLMAYLLQLLYLAQAEVGR